MTKYLLKFVDVDGNECSVSFDVAGYSGNPIMLTGSSDPLTIYYNGKESDIFQQIITSKAGISIDYNKDFVRDVKDIDDKSIPVTINYGKGFRWVGYLIADKVTYLFQETPYIIEFTAVDPFSYLKEKANRIISGTDVMGLKSFHDIITTIIAASKPLPINVTASIAPFVNIGGVWQSYSVLGLFKDLLIRVETFMEDGLINNGYDIISSICDIFSLTAFIFNGIVYFRNAKSLLTEPTKNIGIVDYVSDEWIEGNEQITRSQGVVQLGVRQVYPDDFGGSFILNNFLYFIDDSKPIGQEVTGWTYRTDGDFANYSVTKPKIKKEDYRGVTINGLIPNSVIGAAWSVPNYPKYMTAETTGYDSGLDGAAVYLHLKIRYKYHIYDQSQTTKNIKYSISLVAKYSDGSLYACIYSGEGGRTKLNTGWSHLTNSNTLPMQYITFPLANSESEQTFELSIDPNFDLPSGKGQPTFILGLYPIRTDSVNRDYIDQYTIGTDAVPPSINIIEASLMPDAWPLSDTTTNSNFMKLFAADETNVRSNSMYSEVLETLEVKAGVMYGAGNTYSDPDAKLPWDSINGAIVIDADGIIPVERFLANGRSGKLITLNARDRMFFLRGPKNLIQVDLKSSGLRFTDILTMEGKIDGKYLQVADEYNVRDCIHTLSLIELKGRDDSNDIIENHLSSE